MAENKKVSADGKSTSSTKTWSPSETQKAFLKDLESYPDGISLKALEIETGHAYATGSINALIVKRMVATSDGNPVECKVVMNYNGVDYVVGKTTKNWLNYKLVK